MKLIEQLETRTLFANYTASTVAELTVALNAANASAQADTITLAAGATFALTAVDNATNGATGLPTIAANSGVVTIVGNGSTIARSAHAGTPAFRLIKVAPQASAILTNLTLQNGLALSPAIGAPAQGGAVFNEGTLVLNGVTVLNSTAQGADGIKVSAGWLHNVPGTDAAGGGVYSSGALTLSGCTLRDNAARGGRGADAFPLPPPEPGNQNPWFPPSAGGNASGGGLYLAGGTASITNSTFRTNIAQGGSGGANIFMKKPTYAASGQGIGGGLYISAAAAASLDADTVSRFVKNVASTSNKDIFGSYVTA